MPVIDEIIDPNFKSGTSQSGKPWQLMKVRVGGNEATIFAPAAIGDEVKLNYSEQYKNYSAEKMTQARKERDDIIEKLDEILSILKAGAPSGSGGVEAGKPVGPINPEQQPALEGEVNLDDIPF